MPAQKPTVPRRNDDQGLSPSEAERRSQQQQQQQQQQQYGVGESARSGRWVERLVHDVDRRFEGTLAASPSKLAADDGLFLAALPTVDLHLSAGQADTLALARRAMARLDELLHGLRRSHDVASPFVSNLQHLVLVLQHALEHAMVRQCRSRRGALDRCGRKLLAWFSEFAGGQRPVSTTWPWANLRPALAVLWGVCWMFYEGPARPAKMRARWLLAEVGRSWPMPREDEYATYGRTLMLSDHVPPRLLPPTAAAPQRRPATQHTQQPEPQQPEPQQHPQHQAPAAPRPASLHLSLSQLESSCDRFRPTLSPRSQSSAVAEYKGNAWSDASGAQTASSRALQALSRPWPYQSGIATRRLDFDALFPSNNPSWPPHVDNLTPHLAPAQPHPHHSLGSQTFPMSAATLVANHHHHHHHHLNHHPVMTSDYKSIPPSPISMNGDNSSAMHQQNSRKRKAPDHSVAAPHVHHVLDVHSDRDSSEERYDNYTPRGKYIHKRTEEPPRNPEGKMICTFSPDCSSLTFERKCEWSKHMDKHDRPYVCRHKGCEKLQGFTYSGGLLRHEREVHKMHGGTKKALFCPHQDCKRSMGAGFTRKENLAEHIRRVHRRASASDAASSGMRVEDDGSERLSPDQEHDDAYHAAASSAAGKRRKTACGAVGGEGGGEGGAAVAAAAASAIHGGDAPGTEADEDDLRAEIKRLRREIEEKDARLEKLEAAVEALSKQATTSATTTTTTTKAG